MSEQNLLLKRSFDITLSVLALICVAPTLAAAMLLIVLETSGSPFFTQLRYGQGGKPFRIFKLRTMFVGSESGSFKTVSEDERLTKVGSWLRRLNIDELPQLVNVLIGDMSIIGPRPLSLEETRFLIEQAHFSREYPGLMPSFKPGLVGLEQINRSRSLTYAERFEFNNQYESQWTPMSDIKILWKAVVLCSPVCVAVAAGAVLLLSALAF
ncbi:MAG: sugar transferase [Terriglobales bacterium]